MNLYAAEKTESGSSLSETDRAILDSYAKLLPAFSAVLGGCCLVVLRSAAEKTYPCIAVEKRRDQPNQHRRSRSQFYH